MWALFPSAFFVALSSLACKGPLHYLRCLDRLRIQCCAVFRQQQWLLRHSAARKHRIILFSYIDLQLVVFSRSSNKIPKIACFVRRRRLLQVQNEREPTVPSNKILKIVFFIMNNPIGNLFSYMGFINILLSLITSFRLLLQVRSMPPKIL